MTSARFLLSSALRIHVFSEDEKVFLMCMHAILEDEKFVLTSATLSAQSFFVGKCVFGSEAPFR